MSRFKDLTNQRFGYLKVIERTDDYITKSGKRYTQWLCECLECHEKIICQTSNIKQIDDNAHCRGWHGKSYIPDLTNQSFGRLRAIEKFYNKFGEISYHCKCSCGNDTDVTASNLYRNKVKSCGCYKYDFMMENAKDLSNQRFGRWTALYKIRDENNNMRWHCVCSCGTERDIKSSDLTSGHTMSCGCYAREQISKRCTNDLTNQRFGKLVVKYKMQSKSKHAHWYCECDCGKTKIVSASHLVSGHTRSCGCFHQEIRHLRLEDLTNQRFGKLVAKCRTDNMSGQTAWICECDCGNRKPIRAISLKLGMTISCGCLSMSKLEYLAKNVFDNHNYEYKQQMKYSGLTGIGGNLLSYDFIINDFNCLIECQGAQHYFPIEFFGGEEQFEVQQFHDELKREYAREHGIKLIEVPYTLDTYEKVEEFLLKELSSPDKS